ncbi:hypothetical protein KEM09_21410 [Carboxylicivirga mesophila]|uniref:DUF5056 domain-containing protein n=1 Tax=Carboxylicivirga mesophila TaxID=1166478 RepID=A0ABS5KG33_9BACT|nr:hypothetical protein [Carboxylicivirga mesophila]MBS2213981.1 hypothetical protein [Carboxylicivirga mesophila]
MKEKDKYSEDIHDELIKDLFKEYSLEEAPASLKSETMNRVFSDWTENALSYKPIINKRNRLWMIGGFAALLAISFLIDASVIIDYWNKINVNNSIIDLSKIYKQMGSLGTTMNSLPSIIYFTIAGILALLGIDRFFNRLANI